ncbi:ddrA [Xenorhabdus sp. 42]|uniref:ddrA n=1 Tax=Xenorhabdus szentirmaii TaxID=290112 RepID=UPI0019C9191F|nr:MULTISPECIES: ddrA [unclassified Xenorhabdus]MBD2780811.1 ddrA [Xenorhabdus sp. 38]MBD2819745.1 ddrA [Xenorhabdus sp. 42]
MKLSPLEILDLQDQLSDRLGTLVTADPLTQLDIQDEITVIMEKLGYGVPFMRTEHIGDMEPVQEQTNTDIPQIVADYLAGKCITQKTDEFITTLEGLEPYVSTYITMPQVCDGAKSWWEKTGKQLAA